MLSKLKSKLQSKLCLAVLSCSLLGNQTALSKIKVTTTTSDLRSLVETVGGDKVDVTSLAKGNQDPHFVEAKPSFMLRLSRTDLLVSIGLGLEVGWLPAALSGARNKAIMPGASGSLVLGKFIKPLDVHHGEISREHGDVHPEGNPHFTLDPVIMGKLAFYISNKLGEINPKEATYFHNRAEAFQNTIEKKMTQWATKIKASKVKNIVTYHKALVYLFERFDLNNFAQIEPKPGVPPNPAHILSLIKKMKAGNVNLILQGHLYDDAAAKRIKQDIPSVAIKHVAIAVDGKEGASDLIALYDQLVNAITSSSQGV